MARKGKKNVKDGQGEKIQEWKDEGRHTSGVQRNKKEEQTTTVLLEPTRQFRVATLYYYSMYVHVRDTRIQQWKAPPHPPLPQASDELAGRGSYTE